MDDGIGDIELAGSPGAGLADSCAAGHSVPFGGAGSAGNVFTRPDSRDAPHLFGLGLQEMLADEITKDLRRIRQGALVKAALAGIQLIVPLLNEGISYGYITVYPDGTVDYSAVEGIDLDLRVRPSFAEGGTISIRELIVVAFNAEMGLESPDPDLLAASGGADVTSPSGMQLTGSLDTIEAPPASHFGDDPDGDGVSNEVDAALVDHTEPNLLNHFGPGSGEQSSDVIEGREHFDQIGCTSCHIHDLVIKRDRLRVVSQRCRAGGMLDDRVVSGRGAPPQLRSESLYFDPH